MRTRRGITLISKELWDSPNHQDMMLATFVRNKLTIDILGRTKEDFYIAYVSGPTLPEECELTIDSAMNIPFLHLWFSPDGVEAKVDHVARTLEIQFPPA